MPNILCVNCFSEVEKNSPARRMNCARRSFREISGGCAHQSQTGDLRRRAKAFGWPPIAGAAADVDPTILKAMQAGGEGLLEADEEIPGPELSTVGVAGNLQLKAGVRGILCAARLVRQ